MVESRDHFLFLVWFLFQYMEGWHVSVQYISSLPSSWQDVIGMECRSWKSKSMVDVLSRLVLSSTVYNLWRARNEIKYKGQPKIEEHILKVFILEVRSKISGKWGFKKSMENFNICQNWNLNVNMLM
jgi:hypothetical protein